MDYTFENFEWKLICQAFSYNGGHKLLQFNLIHIVFQTPQRLHKINNTKLSVFIKLNQATLSSSHDLAFNQVV